MADDLTIHVGNRLADYRDKALDVSRPHHRGRMWLERILRSRRDREIEERTRAVERGRVYLSTCAVRADKRVIRPHLYPLMQDAFMNILPRIPTPRVEATDDRGEVFEDKARVLLDYSFRAMKCRVEAMAHEAMWDAANWGEAITKTIWRTDVTPARLADVTDQQQLAIEMGHAEDENADPLSAGVAEDDIDAAHLEIHTPYLMELDFGPERDALAEHVHQHQVRLVEINREWPECRRVCPGSFVYDLDHDWENRFWEAEQEDMRIEELDRMGCRNLNEENLPLLDEEDEEGQYKLAYEDMRVRVWRIHDRLHGQEVIIPHADEGRQILPLMIRPWLYEGVDIYVRQVFRPRAAEEPHGWPTVQAAIPIVDALAEIEFNIERHVKNHAGYKWLLAGRLDDALKSGISDPDKKFVDGFTPEQMLSAKEHSPPPIPQTLLDQWQREYSVLRQVVGADLQDIAASNPHQISATESAHRADVRAGRQEYRQDAMGNLLAKVASNFLQLYQTLAHQSVRVRLLGPEGAWYDTINPADLPGDLDIYVDVRNETDVERGNRLAFLRELSEHMQAVGYPADWLQYTEDYARAGGLPRPERYRMEMQPAAPAEKTPGAQTGQSGLAQRTLTFPHAAPA